MCKIGDIIGVRKYVGQDGKDVDFHYFVVVSDEKGKICGLSFNIVGTVMSSFKDDEQRRKKSSLKQNIPVETDKFSLGNHIKKEGFIKADQLYYFDKNKTSFFVVGQVDGDVLLTLIDRIGLLDKEGLLTININNLLKDTINS